MRITGKIKVALVTPPLAGHLGRGTGVYYQNLILNLKKDNSLIVREINLSYPDHEFDLVHYPYFDPFFLTLPLLAKSGKPTLVTVHDLIPLKYPDKFPKGLRGLFKWNIQRNSLSRATLIITDSLAAKKDIVKIIRVRENKVQVVYLGVDSVFKKIKSYDSLQKTRAKFNLPPKFLLHVGDVNYNKNIPNLIAAFSQIAQEFPDLFLVLVGQGFIRQSAQLEEVLSLIKKYNLENKIIRLSDLDSGDLVNLYNLACIYLQPSFAEGFGLPVLEAFACETAVVAGNRASLPEIAGDAALLVDPADIAAIATSVRRLLQDQSLKEKLIKAGERQVKKFTWQKTSDQTVRLYQKALGLKDYQLK